jgi:hypothetical protein
MQSAGVYVYTTYIHISKLHDLIERSDWSLDPTRTTPEKYIFGFVLCFLSKRKKKIRTLQSAGVYVYTTYIRISKLHDLIERSDWSLDPARRTNGLAIMVDIYIYIDIDTHIHTYAHTHTYVHTSPI